MTRNEEAIVRCCERYIKDDVPNKYVCEYYKKLTGTELPSTDKTNLRNAKNIKKRNTLYVLNYIVIGIPTEIFVLTSNKLPVWLSLFILCMVFIAFLRVLGTFNRGIAKLLWSNYSCDGADEWFVDYLIGRGIVKL